jgi:hypothetical protein
LEAFLSGAVGINVFVAGFPRSGTTLLAAILGRHKEIASLPECHFFDDVSVRLKGSILRPAESVDSILNNSRLMDLELVRSCKEDIVVRSKGSLPCLIKEISLAERRRTGKKYVVEKTPENLLHVEEIFNQDNAARVICLIRDGRSAVYSNVKVEWAHDNYSRHSAEWQFYVDEALRLKEQYPDKIMLLRYEDLISYPENTVKELCKFCDVDYSESMLGSDCVDVVPAWEKEWKKQALGRIDRTKLDEWKGAIPEDKVGRIESLMANGLLAFGYIVEVDKRSFLRDFLYSPAVYRGFFRPVIRLLRYLKMYVVK